MVHHAAGMSAACGGKCPGFVFETSSIQGMSKSRRYDVNDIPAMLRKVRAIVLYRGVASQDVDDLVQEAFVRVETYARKHDVRSHEALMVTAAMNINRDKARHRARVSVTSVGLDIDHLVDGSPQPEEQLVVRERLRRTASGLKRLDARTRRCLLAKRIDGLTAAQIAEREGLSVAAVEKRVARAVLFLTQWMGEI